MLQNEATIKSYRKYALTIDPSVLRKLMSYFLCEDLEVGKLSRYYEALIQMRLIYCSTLQARVQAVQGEAAEQLQHPLHRRPESVHIKQTSSKALVVVYQNQIKPSTEACKVSCLMCIIVYGSYIRMQTPALLSSIGLYFVTL